jgi:hypothetical protein
MPAEGYQTEPVASLVRIVKGKGFKKAVTEIGGYDTSEMGATTFIS